jgi:hypothetical protein
MRTLCLLVVAVPTLLWASPADEFWDRLQTLCGQAFAGELVRHPEGEEGMVGRALIAEVRYCGPEEIRIPFHVGDDRSRVWVITRTADRLRLSHEHTHADGTPDDVTGYGGQATNAGRAGRQLFPADEATRGMIEPAFANVWSLDIEPGDRLVYGLRRLGTEREYRVEFDLSRPVASPPAPWGGERNE